MQFLNAIAIMVIAFSLPIITTKPYTSKCIADPTILSSVPKKFALAIVSPNNNNNNSINSTDLLWPLALSWYSLPTGQFVPAPFTSDYSVTIFTLKNKRLSAIGIEATFLPEEYDADAKRGLQVPVFTPDFNFTPALFTAREACDSYNRKFLRLGGPDGEYASFGLLKTNLWSCFFLISIICSLELTAPWFHIRQGFIRDLRLSWPATILFQI